MCLLTNITQIIVLNIYCIRKSLLAIALQVGSSHKIALLPLTLLFLGTEGMTVLSRDTCKNLQDGLETVDISTFQRFLVED
ncbi:hypothetical protein [Nostoc sp.]|uniref:hypothetical protein n=1 Tax=Nostoc sp. TaxID=1180 RepID=UPI002FF96AE6